MEIDSQKRAIEKRIVDRSLTEYDQKNLSEDDLISISDFTLSGLKNVSSREDLINFLSEISSKWPIFKEIAMIEQGDRKEAVEDEVYEGVLILAKNGKINDAIKLSKTVTTNG